MTIKSRWVCFAPALVREAFGLRSFFCSALIRDKWVYKGEWELIVC